jgi:hypothetical protein
VQAPAAGMGTSINATHGRTRPETRSMNSGVEQLATSLSATHGRTRPVAASMKQPAVVGEAAAACTAASS